MKFSTPIHTLTLAVYLFSSSIANAVTLEKRDDGDGDNQGIPTISDVQNPVCKPWVAIRDAIMGDIFHAKFKKAGPFTDHDFGSLERFHGSTRYTEPLASGTGEGAREYAKAHEKMGLLGGQDVDSLTECTEIMPPAIHLRDITTTNSGGAVDPPVDPAKLEAAIQQTRSIRLQ
ncbi:hypothetical protein K435DRAFT_808665 [Dendrothele bispora CBS 962.96]|uniref:Uncharacterized protein n=1 Tax=Dendrothele bispora (strain CBS 962.96) TaxID=1314807 RepID=A0A4S8L135_DENBC|nr:hypothetical protein K435DRAFT_808665 [Dendrothele bispora CBS 962.96]